MSLQPAADPHSADPRPFFPLLTVCGLEEIEQHGTRGVTHVLSILDPGWPDPESFREGAGVFGPIRRLVLRFHDEIEPRPGVVLPEREDVGAILAFGREIAGDPVETGHLLIHCHAGVSRSTAAMAMLIAQAHPGLPETHVMDRLVAIRPQAWPNLRMTTFADEALGRSGRLVAAAGRVYARRLEGRPDLAEIMERLGRTREVEAARMATGDAAIGEAGGVAAAPSSTTAATSPVA